MNSKSLKLINVGNLLTYNSKKKSMISEQDLEIIVSNGKIIGIGKNLKNADTTNSNHFGGKTISSYTNCISSTHILCCYHNLFKITQISPIL